MKLSPQPPGKIIKILQSIGFSIVRQKGSHVILKRADGRLTVVPFHKGEDIGVGLLLKIFQDADITKEEFFCLLEQKRK
jgi:predicted RNA binding protein YcfA (HicA-like mRNA interferase family)